MRTFGPSWALASTSAEGSTTGALIVRIQVAGQGTLNEYMSDGLWGLWSSMLMTLSRFS